MERDCCSVIEPKERIRTSNPTVASLPQSFVPKFFYRLLDGYIDEKGNRDGTRTEPRCRPTSGSRSI
jgi:hypothetical protein